MSGLFSALAKILSTVVKSLFFSGMIVIIFLSIVTGGFPPDFRRLNRAFGGVQELSKLSPQQSRGSILADNHDAGLDEEKDVAELEAYNRQRAKIGEDLFGSTNTPEEEDGRIIPLRQVSSIEANDEIKSQLRDMQQEMFRLQQRVNELESELKKNKKRPGIPKAF